MSDRRNRETNTREQETDRGDEASDEKMYTGEEVDTGTTKYRPQQQNVGRDNMQGSGEWPDPDTSPSPAASGADPHDGVTRHG